MESSVLCGASAPLFQRTLNRAYLPTFTGEEDYKLSLRPLRNLGRQLQLPEVEPVTGLAHRGERGNVMPLGKVRAQVTGVQHGGGH